MDLEGPRRWLCGIFNSSVFLESQGPRCWEEDDAPNVHPDKVLTETGLSTARHTASDPGSEKADQARAQMSRMETNDEALFF